MAPTITQDGVERTANPDGTIREVLPRVQGGPALGRQQSDRERELQFREWYTVDLRDVPGKGPTRKIKAEWGCPNCHAPVFGYGDKDHSWFLPHSLCDSCAFAEALDGDDALPILHPGEVLAAEFQKFSAQWANLAKVLQPLVAKAIPRPGSTGLFDPGEITRPRGSGGGSDRHPAPSVQDGLWLSLIERHCSGDHGDFSSSAAVKLDDTARSFARLYGPATRNAAAIEAGSGLVRSRFEFPAEMHGDLPDGHLDAPRFRTSGDFGPQPREGVRVLARLDVATLLSPAGNKTHCRAGRVGEQCFRDEQ